MARRQRVSATPIGVPAPPAGKLDSSPVPSRLFKHSHPAYLAAPLRKEPPRIQQKADGSVVCQCVIAAPEEVPHSCRQARALSVPSSSVSLFPSDLPLTANLCKSACFGAVVQYPSRQLLCMLGYCRSWSMGAEDVHSASGYLLQAAAALFNMLQQALS